MPCFDFGDGSVIEMDIFSIKIEDIQNIVLTLNWVAALILIILTAGVSLLIRWVYKKTVFKKIQISEATIGIGNSSITIKYDGRIKEIAYKIWIELTTRKIGIKFDENNDVISEVYDSWYEAFKVIRTLLEEIPADRIKESKGLIDLTTKVLNEGLRPHLTVWQAKFRRWYDHAAEIDETKSPQEIQKGFSEYQDLVKDLQRTNDIMMKYAAELKRLIDDK